MIRQNAHRNRGGTLVFALITTAVVGIIVITVARTIKQNTMNMVHFENMQRSFRVAESGMHKSLGRITNDSNIFTQPGFEDWQTDADENGKYRTMVSTAIFDGVPGYYVVTEAVRKQKEKEYSLRLHTYARISNVSDYFAAIDDSLGISFPADIREGKVYGVDLYFAAPEPGSSPLASPGSSDWSWGTPVPDSSGSPSASGSPAPSGSPGGSPAPPAQDKTRVKRAEYVNNTNWSDPYVQSGVVIYDSEYPTVRDPVQLPDELLFPQVTEEELDFFRGIAGDHKKCIFDKSTDADPTFGTVDIFPPGYWTGDGLPWPDDMYPSSAYPDAAHTSDNADHVYFCSGTARVEGTVHGQVLIVAEDDIFISSSIFSASDTNYPGVGSMDPDQEEHESGAHQLILVTKGNVIVDNTFIENPGTTNPLTVVTQHIQAMIFAPNSSFFPENYPAPWRSKLALEFKGSMVLGTLESTVKFPDVFQAWRRYQYMTSLRTDPPPYIPVLVDIYHSVEERTDIAFPVTPPAP